LISAHSYSQLALKYNEGGGAFTFLRKINHEGFAGSLSWVLILGYILTYFHSNSKINDTTQGIY